MSKSIAFNKKGTEVYVSDFLLQYLYTFTWDTEEKVLKAVEKDHVMVTKGRMDNMK